MVYIGSGSAFEATSERSVGSCMRAAEVQMVGISPPSSDPTMSASTSFPRA